MKVSIIVPVYNTEQYLEECLDSLRNQIYKNIEVILVDDGSRDGSGGICDRYAAQDDRFVVVHNTNHGVSYSRNCGLKIASGDYISFVDSDDIVDEHYVQYLLDAAQKYGADVACCSMVRFYENGQREEVHLWDTDKQFCGNEIFDYAAGKEKTFVGYVWGKIYVAQIIKENGLFFDEKIQICEDSLFAYHVFSAAATTVVIPYPLYDYRIRQGSATTDALKNPDHIRSKLYAFTAALSIAEQVKNEKFKRNIYTVLFETTVALCLSLSANGEGRQIDKDFVKKMGEYYAASLRECISVKLKLFYRLLRINKRVALFAAKQYLEKKNK